MPKYLITGSYTAEGIKGLMKDGGTKRLDAVRAAMKSVGGSVDAAYFALGEHDVYITVDAPDHAAVTAVALAAGASGAVRVRTTALLTPAEVDAAVKKAVTYTPPGR
ncbi:MAG TPA: GYD domain-containing protein [Vicinamibacterales bacterium]|jgi:uncharacterized protein with GYD domain|nr:GYD domain-containing protein [Vicinamibacterales bacterium]